VLAAVAANATPEVFDDMLARARNATDTLEKQTYYTALANVRDPELARRALDIAFEEDVHAAHAALAGTMINVVSGNHQQMAYDFAESHRAELNARLDPFTVRSFLPGLAVGSNDPALARRVRAYIDALPQTGRRTPEAFYANLNERLQTRERRMNEASTWLAGGRAR
jgi:aminopeptidase N